MRLVGTNDAGRSGWRQFSESFAAMPRARRIRVVVLFIAAALPSVAILLVLLGAGTLRVVGLVMLAVSAAGWFFGDIAVALLRYRRSR